MISEPFVSAHRILLGLSRTDFLLVLVHFSVSLPSSCRNPVLEPSAVNGMVRKVLKEAAEEN